MESPAGRVYDVRAEEGAFSHVPVVLSKICKVEINEMKSLSILPRVHTPQTRVSIIFSHLSDASNFWTGQILFTE
jgi:hypothetical protein